MLHRKLWVSKMLLEIINIFLLFSGKFTKKELSKTKTVYFLKQTNKKKGWFGNLDTWPIVPT